MNSLSDATPSVNENSSLSKKIYSSHEKAKIVSQALSLFETGNLTLK